MTGADKLLMVVTAVLMALTLWLFPETEARPVSEDQGAKTILLEKEDLMTSEEIEAICIIEPSAPIEVEALPVIEETPVEVDLPVIDEAELEMLACVIYQEAGGDAYSDRCRRYVGDVALNRVADPRYPDTLEGVLTQRAQYGRFYWTGIVWPARASKPKETHAVDRAYRIARELLEGNHSELYGEGYIYQAEFKQGKDIIYVDWTYFGR